MNLPRNKWLKAVVLTGSLLAGWLLWNLNPAGSFTIEIGEDTTYVLGPLNADGTVNYVDARNSFREKDVPNESNAAVGIIQLFGSQVLESHARERIYAVLGLDGNLIAEPKDGPFWKYLHDANIAERTWVVESYEDADEDTRASDRPLVDRLRRLKQSPWQEQDDPDLVEWLSTCKEPLAALQTASDKPRLFIPWVPNATPPVALSSYSFNFSPLRHAGSVLKCRGMMNVGSGRVAEAWKDAITLCRLGRLLAQDSSMIAYLQGLDLDLDGCRIILEIAKSPNLSADDARAFLSEWARLPSWPDPTTMLDYEERFFALDGAMILIRQRSLAEIVDPEEFGAGFEQIDVNAMLRYINDRNDQLAAPFGKECYADRHAAVLATWDAFGKIVDSHRDWTNSLPGQIAWFFKSRRQKSKQLGAYAGKILMAMFQPNVRMVDRAYTRCLAYNHLSHVSLALAAWGAERGSYPGSLQELRPGYFEQLPEDPYACRDLQYYPGRDSYRLYSVGGNRKDEGGAPEQYDGAAGDIVVEANPRLSAALETRSTSEPTEAP